MILARMKGIHVEQVGDRGDMIETLQKEYEAEIDLPRDSGMRYRTRNTGAVIAESLALRHHV
jgi:hypothetical protein